MLPILDLGYQSSLDGVVVHVLQFFIYHLLGEYVEVIVPCLPNRFTHANARGICREVLLYPLLEFNRRSPFPLLHELAQHAGLFKMYNGVDMIGHNYKAHARSIGFAQLIGEKVNDNALGTIVVKDSSPSVAREGYKMSMAFEIKDFALHCHSPRVMIIHRSPLAAARPDKN